jgi:hypothetical protein
MCDEPWNCGVCTDFHTKIHRLEIDVECLTWLCPQCVNAGLENVETYPGGYYQSGKCDCCEEYSPILQLMFTDLKSATLWREVVLKRKPNG